MLHIRPNAGQNGYINFTENAVDDRWSIGVTAGDGSFYFRRPYPTSPALVTIASTGAATFSSTLGINGVADNVKGGTYTPTGSNGGNVGSITMREHSYIRVGNIVTVSGVAEFTPTAASSLCTLEITLPFASTFTTSFQANGAASNSVSNTLGYVQSGTNKAQIIFISDTGPTAIAARYTFQYQIL
jgi:hypothetical protein